MAMGDLARTDEYDPFAAETFVNPAVKQVMGDILTLPQRAIQNSQFALDTGNYDPGPTLEAATLPMGTGAIAGVPMRAGEAVVGAGPIRAYHSSPHDFDRFDLSKIGTGEGAQVYGHGLYFAENPAVSGQGGQYWQQFANRFGSGENTAAQHLANAGFDRELAAQRLRDMIANPNETLSPHNLKTVQNMRQEALGLLEGDKPVGPRTYEVNINADPAHFLDWDKPLSQQPHVLDVLKQQGYKDAPWPYSGRLVPTGPKGVMVDLEGQAQDAYRALGTARKDGYTQYNYPAATQALNEAGIPGIKYLDQGSRNLQDAAELRRSIANVQNTLAQDPQNASAADLLRTYQAQLADAGKATSNYVVWRPDIIQIMRKYGIAGLPAGAAGMGALAAQDNYQPGGM